MMPDARDPVVAALRAGLEAWEREAAVQWDALIRSPGVLRRLSDQIAQALVTQQRVSTALSDSARRAAQARQGRARALARLEQIEAQIGTLAERLDRVERALDEDR
jgi:hypothetical protein